MTLKTCVQCKKEFEPFSKKGGRCRPCKQEYDRNYHKNRSPDKKAVKNAKQRDRKRKIREYINNYLQDKSCECGENRIPCLQFDHTEPDNKLDAVANMIRNGFSLDSIFNEINKCQVICANCHAIKTAKQFNWYS